MKELVIYVKSIKSGDVQRARCRHCRFCDRVYRKFTGRCSTSFNTKGEWVNYKEINIHAFCCEKFEPYFLWDIVKFNVQQKLF